MSSGKAMAGITVVNSALGFFSGDFFSPLDSNPAFLELLFLLKSGTVPWSWLNTRGRSPEGVDCVQ